MTATPMINSLEIDGMRFEPTRYREEALEGELQLHAIFRATREETDRIHQIMRDKAFVPVIRHGIDEGSVRLRFGMSGWSEDGDHFKHYVFMIDGKFDDTRSGASIVTIREARVESQLTFTAAYLKQVVALLVEKELVSSDQIEEMKERAKQGMWDVQRSWLKVLDVDDIEFD